MASSCLTGDFRAEGGRRAARRWARRSALLSLRALRRALSPACTHARRACPRGASTPGQRARPFPAWAAGPPAPRPRGSTRPSAEPGLGCGAGRPAGREGRKISAPPVNAMVGKTGGEDTRLLKNRASESKHFIIRYSTKRIMRNSPCHLLDTNKHTKIKALKATSVLLTPNEAHSPPQAHGNGAREGQSPSRAPPQTCWV